MRAARLPAAARGGAIACALLALSLASTRPAASAGALQTIAVTGGQPDDITVDTKGRLVWGDLARNTVVRLQGGRMVTVASGISVPEGIVPLANGSLIVAEQGLDRIDRVDTNGGIHPIYALSPVAGQEGVDGIGRDPRTGRLVVPDSPRGTVLEMNTAGGGVRLLVRGLGRPVDAAVDRRGDVLVPDEHLGTLVQISPGGKVSYRGAMNTPDDVAIDRSGRVWVTSLGDGGLWLFTSGSAPRRILSGLANPQGLTLDRCGDPIIVEQNSSRIVRLLLTARSRRCRY